MSEQQNEAREAAWASLRTPGNRRLGFAMFDAGHAHATAEMAERVERLRAALRAIRDMPEYDQDDCHRLRNKAGVALGKPETSEGEGE